MTTLHEMTSILAFRINNGNQMVIVGDTCHTYGNSTLPETKIKLFNRLLFCGSGYDRIIDDFFEKILHFKSRNNMCANHIISLQDELIQKYTRLRRDYPNIDTHLTPNSVMECSFFMVNIDSLKGNSIFEKTNNSINDINMLGSGSPNLGAIKDALDGRESFRFRENTKEILFKKIIEIYSNLGKYDPLTGHPAIFDLDVCILGKSVRPKIFKLKFRYNVEKLGNYNCVEND